VERNLVRGLASVVRVQQDFTQLRARALALYVLQAQYRRQRGILAWIVLLDVSLIRRAIGQVK
jgi:hypothetical protein